MAISGKRLNLSQPEFKKKISGGNYRVAVVCSRWNSEITKSLLKGAVEELQKSNVKKENILISEVPGSFELPLAASWHASDPTVDGVICLGCLIKGDTPHFDYIAQATAAGIMDVSLQYQKPVVFGVITTLNIEQARERAGGSHGNKGVEAALTCLHMIELKKSI
ncbi:MAG: 6,7-dimethyl-8-ribityllumazine synthase [Bacteroidia bacterium]|nr:6,7-dimethyl-8-ribityllumazine synthase [Bacteroidia bacterium]